MDTSQVECWSSTQRKRTDILQQWERFLNNALRSSGEETAFSYARELKRLVRTHETWRNTKSLNLLSSENFASPEVRNLLSSDFSNRYSSREGFYRGIKYSNEIENLASEVAR